MQKLELRVKEAVRHFWKTRYRQQTDQKKRGAKDQGTRGSATGGSHLDGFSNLFKELLIEAGIPNDSIYRGEKAKMYLPGFFRANKQWDMLVIYKGNLIIALELKSQVGSFGNNHNNRIEEALGNATDFWIAFREGAFQSSPRPWLGYFVLLEDTKRSTSPVRVYMPHFEVMAGFEGSSYAKRYNLFCEKAVRERCYDSACLMLSDRNKGKKGDYREFSKFTGINSFVASMTTHAASTLAALRHIVD